MILFQETEPIKAHRAFTQKNNIKWYTWSDYFMSETKGLTQQSRLIKEIDFLYLKKYKEYNYSYAVNVSKLDKEFVSHFKQYATALYHFSPGEGLLFFNTLINDKINGKLFHFIFALFRSLLVQITKDEMSALYSPLATGKKENDFPLHCDLYIPKTLFNVFENVAPDSTGQSTFLKLDTLFEVILPQVKGIDKGVIKDIYQLVYKNIKQDNYEKFYAALYDDERQKRELQKLQNKFKIKIRLRKGEGYLLNDRVWMHGRDKTNGGVSSKRLHRLIYNTFQSSTPFFL